MDERRNDGVPCESGVDTTAIMIVEEVAQYRRTGDGEHLMTAMQFYFRFYAARSGRDPVVEGVGEAFLRAWERWLGGRMDRWDPGSAPVRTLGQAFGVADRDMRWKPAASTALLSPLTRSEDGQAQRTSPGPDARFIWPGQAPPLKEGEPLAAEHIPPGASILFALIWTVEQLLERGFVVSNDPKDARNVFVETARLLAKRPDADQALLDGRTKQDRGHLGWNEIKTLYYDHRPPKHTERDNRKRD